MDTVEDEDSVSAEPVGAEQAESPSGVEGAEKAPAQEAESPSTDPIPASAPAPASEEADPTPAVDAAPEAETVPAPEAIADTTSSESDEAAPTALQPETAPEPEAEAAPETAPETAAEPEAAPETTPEAKPEAEVTRETTPEPEPETEATPETAAEAELQAEAAPEPEAKAEVEVGTAPDATPEAKSEAAAAPTDGPESEAAPEAERTPGPEADTAPEVPPVSEPASTVVLEKVAAQAPGLVSLVKAASGALDKQGLAGQRAAVYLVLDRSGSMRRYYKDGTVQHLAEQALALSVHLDDDGSVPVVFFSTDIDGTSEVDLANYGGRIEEVHASLGHMGRTNYHRAIEAVVEHYRKSGATAPAFVIFQTDGAPTSKPAAEKALCEAAGLPIFWQFIGFGDPAGKGFDFLRKLDELAVPEKRVVDNAGFFHAGLEPRELADAALYQELTAEFPEWLREARAAGIVQD
ncbi:VWA domain-containing protein [Streptomyces palmae]|uniref:VWA domain-containing protein n=2 Tax=Streptomyces palmae TaxID=1701085 RepID=A0A4Z0H6C5_9ACTN|nr:VWA domain-containing protein [Streptomyces palmae]